MGIIIDKDGNVTMTNINMGGSTLKPNNLQSAKQALNSLRNKKSTNLESAREALRKGSFDPRLDPAIAMLQQQRKIEYEELHQEYLEKYMGQWKAENIKFSPLSPNRIDPGEVAQ